jgi:hypothetical protein
LAVLGLFSTLSSVDKLLNCCSRLEIGSGMVVRDVVEVVVRLLIVRERPR